MQNVSQTFLDRSRAPMRELSYRVVMSFEKQFDDDIDFFSIGTSLIGGADFIKGVNDVVQEWDKYIYADYTSRVKSIEWTRQVEEYSSVTLAMADIVLENHDDYFTPNSDSPISDYILPYRPIRIYAGFGDELIPVFIGITENMPVINEKAKTASFHCIDFMYTLFNRPLDESVMFVNKRSDEVIQGLLEAVGLISLQLNLDQGNTILPYAYFEKGQLLRNAFINLMAVEQGRLYMDENGVITFRNRSNYNNESVYSFDAYANILDYSTRKQDEIINVAQIEGGVLEEQPKQEYWKSSEPILIPANTSGLEIWAGFQDPVTSVDDPDYFVGAITSSYTVNTQSDGSGSASTSLVLDNTTLFAKSFKMEFSNPSSTDLYITEIKLFATPIVKIRSVYVRAADDDSVAKYDERILRLTNDLFQNQTDAESKAAVILRDYGEFGSVGKLSVKGNMALQIDDQIHVDVFGRAGDYKITRIQSRLSQPANFTQVIDVKTFEPATFFTIQVSLIGGEDEIAP